MRLNLGIRAKLLFIVLLILLPLSFLQYYLESKNYEEIVQAETQACQDLAEAISTCFTNLINEIWTQEDAISSFIKMNPDMAISDMQVYFDIVGEGHQVLSRLSWVDTNGVIRVSSAHELIGTSLADKQYIKDIIDGKDETVSSMIKAKIDGKSIIPIAKAVRKDGKLLGIISAPIDVEKLNLRMPESYKSYDKVLNLIDSAGNLVYRSDVDVISDQHRIVPEDSASRKALNGEIVTEIRKPNTDTKKVIVVDYPMKSIGWVCSLSTCYDSVMDKHYNNFKLQMIFSIIILMLISVVSLSLIFLLSDRILNPIDKLKNAVNKIQHGDYSVRANVHGNNEVAQMAQEFDKMAGAIEEYDNKKSQFYTNLSHELKTPLNVIYASAQLIRSLNVKIDICDYHKKVQNNIKVINQNCYRLIRIINNLLDISRLDARFLKPKFGNFNIVSVIEEITMSVVEFASLKDIKIVFDTEIEEKIIECDPDMIERIILNLVSNSLKFTHSGGKIMVNIYDIDSRIVVSVKDTGIGIPKDKLDLIFERYMQIENTMTRNHEGSGLGLSLVKALVEAHGGTISVVSELGKGSEFIIELPAKTSQQGKVTNCNESRRVNHESTIEKVNIEFSDIYFTKG